MATKAELKAKLDALGIEYPNKATNAELEALLPEDERTGKVTATLLNVRVAPGMDASVAYQLKQDAEVTIAGESDEWFELSDGNFVMQKFIDV